MKKNLNNFEICKIFRHESDKETVTVFPISMVLNLENDHSVTP